MIAEIKHRFGLPAGQIAFVGDRLTTDIQMGVDAGFISVLTLTGVTAEADLAGSTLVPDVTVSGMNELRSLLNPEALSR